MKCQILFSRKKIRKIVTADFVHSMVSVKNNTLTSCLKMMTIQSFTSPSTLFKSRVVNARFYVMKHRYALNSVSSGIQIWDLAIQSQKSFCLSQNEWERL